MRRKVIKQANQAFTITLPIEWVRENNISEKSELDFIIDGKSLILTNQGKTQYKKVKINVSNYKDRTIERIVKALYSEGIDEIELESINDISTSILKALENIIGFALVSKKDNLYIIKDIGGTNADLDEIFKRVFQMVISFYESAIIDIFGPKKETMEGLISRDKEINKFCYFLQRAINKMSYKDQIKGRLLFTYSFELEKIGDEIQRLWRTNIQYKVEKNEKIKKLAQLSLEGLEKAFEFYFQFNPNKAEEVYNLREIVREDSMKISGKNSHTTRFIRHIVKIIEESADLSQLTLMIML